MLVGVAASAILFAGSFLVGEAIPAQQTPVTLGTTIARFAVLANTTVTNTVSPTNVTGELGVSTGTSVTNFPPGVVNLPATIHRNDALAILAQTENTAAYNSLKGQTPTRSLTGTDLGGLTLVPGVYNFTSSAGLTGALTLDALGDPNATWVFQIASTLITGSSATVSVVNGGSRCNVYWQVGSSATLGTSTTFVGSIFASTSITLNTGVDLTGRALAQTGAVTLDNNQVHLASCAPVATLPPTNTPTATSTPTSTSTPGPTVAPPPTATPAPASGGSSSSPPRPTATPTVTPLPATATAITAATASASATLPAATQTAIVAATQTAIAAANASAAAPAGAGATGAVAGASAPGAAAPAATASGVPSLAQAAPTPTLTAPTPTRSAPTPAAPSIPVGPAPPVQLPSSLPNAGAGLPSLGLVAFVLGALALVLGLTIRRTRR